MALIKNNRLQYIFFFLLSSILTHAITQVQPISAAVSSSAETSASSSQPLWSYQVKPNSYANVPSGQASNHFAATSSPHSSIFDAFNGLSQRQGALSGSPFLSILPIILIAAGGMLLLLPFLTMMMASPFSGAFGGGGGGYNNGFGFPQVAAMGKKRSVADQSFGQRGLVELIEHVSSTIEELSRKYQPTGNNRRSKAVNLQTVNESQQQQQQTNSASTSNHKLTASASATAAATGAEESSLASSLNASNAPV